MSLLGQLEPDNNLHRERMILLFRMIQLVYCHDWQNNLAVEDEEESPRDHKEEVEGEEDQPSRETVCKISKIINLVAVLKEKVVMMMITFIVSQILKRKHEKYSNLEKKSW